MAYGSRRSQESMNIWPGYVDVLSALLMVLIFVLLIFTFSQFILSDILTGQTNELESLHKRIAAISQQLGLAEKKKQELNTNISFLSSRIDGLTVEKENLEVEVDSLTRKNKEDQDYIAIQLRNIASLQQDIDALRKLREELEGEIQTVVASLESEKQVVQTFRDRTKALQARLADEEEKTLLAQKDIEQRDIRIEVLSALVGEQQQALEEQITLGADARAEVVLLHQKITLLQIQLEEINQALSHAEGEKLAQKKQIEDLGKRLNIELARRVSDLEQYRSEFFGRIRKILGDNPYVRIEGDRFLFQAEFLFPSGSASLGEGGKEQLSQITSILKELSTTIPEDIKWIIRIDGHTDRQPIKSPYFASNWELSTARAVSVVRFFAQKGIPEDRMAATGFSKFHPIDTGDSPEAYRKNRRIEIKLTSR